MKNEVFTMKNTMKKNVKDTMAVGIGSMAGMGAIGAMGSIPGMPANNISQMAGAGFTMANIGQMSKNAMDITKMMGTTRKKVQVKWKK
jgi:Na+-translocating ferredoxin:NAD+ oxidoreductase RnfE subunit